MRLYDHGVRLFGAAEGVVKRTLIAYFNSQPVSRVEMKGSTTFSTIKCAAPGVIRLFDATAESDALVAELTFDKIPGKEFALKAAKDPVLNEHFVAPADALQEADKCDAPATEPTAPESTPQPRESTQEILARLRARSGS